MRAHQRLRRSRARDGDDWLITYADTITLLLCLFVILLSSRAGAPGTAVHAAPPIPHVTSDFFEPPPAPDPEPEKEPREEATVLVSPASPVFVMPEPVMRTEAPRPSPPAVLPPIAERLRALGTAVVEQTGDNVTALRINSGAFFASGLATISPDGKAILRDVAMTLKTGAFAGYRVTVEGHTDDAPISTPLFQSNWELSAARAASVVRFFLELGLPAAHLSAAGYADTFPIAPNRAPDGTILPENQARNRRVVIKVEKITGDDQS